MYVSRKAKILILLEKALEELDVLSNYNNTCNSLYIQLDNMMQDIDNKIQE